MNGPTSEELSQISYWVVVGYYVDISGEYGATIEFDGGYNWCRGAMKVKAGPLVKGQIVEAKINENIVTFSYHKTLLRPLTEENEEDEEDEDEDEDPRNFLKEEVDEELARDDYFNNLKKTYVMELVKPRLVPY